jgi:hypothetical protein
MSAQRADDRGRPPVAARPVEPAASAPAVDRLESEPSPAAHTPVAQHADALAPAEVQRARDETSRTERIGNNTAVANPVESPPATVEGERRPG